MTYPYKPRGISLPTGIEVPPFYYSRQMFQSINPNFSEYTIKNDKNNLTILLDAHNVILKSEGIIDLTDNELNEFLCSYKKTLDDDVLKISICENTREYDY